jgi:hypothetical protein
VEGAMFSLLQEVKTKAAVMAAAKLMLRKPKSEVLMALLFLIDLICSPARRHFSSTGKSCDERILKIHE